MIGGQLVTLEQVPVGLLSRRQTPGRRESTEKKLTRR